MGLSLVLSMDMTSFCLMMESEETVKASADDNFAMKADENVA